MNWYFAAYFSQFWWQHRLCCHKSGKCGGKIILVGQRWVKGLSQFLIMTEQAQKMLLTSKVVKNDHLAIFTKVEPKSLIHLIDTWADSRNHQTKTELCLLFCQLSNGDLKRVEDLTTEDFVRSAEFSHEVGIDHSAVTHLKQSLDNGSVTIGFSVGKQKIQVKIFKSPSISSRYKEYYRAMHYFVFWNKTNNWFTGGLD